MTCTTDRVHVTVYPIKAHSDVLCSIISCNLYRVILVVGCIFKEYPLMDNTVNADVIIR